MTFDVHPGVAMVKKWVEGLPAKTGRSLEEWRDVYTSKVKKFPVRKDLVAVIKKEYGLGTMTAEQIWEFAFGAQTWDGDDDAYLANAQVYVAGQYSGPKAHFLPLFESVIAFARSLGKDVRVCPCKTMVPLYRDRVFAEMRPATKSRFELAMALYETPFDDFLQLNPRAKGNDRQRHIVFMETAKDFTGAVKKWLKKAYEFDKMT